MLAAGWLNHRDGTQQRGTTTQSSLSKQQTPFSLHLKSPLLCLSRLSSTAKSARSCFLSWEDGTQTEGDVEKMGGGVRGADYTVTFQVREVN